MVKESASLYTNPTNELGYGIPDFNLALNTALLNVNSSANNAFLLFPNPANETITISFPSRFESATFSVYNTIGQLILTKNLTNQNSKVELNGIQSGMYLYTLESKSIIQSGKISKQ